jgi:hypothetical protein
MGFSRATGILAASIDEPSGLQMAKHIFVDDKGDYYEITDSLPRFAGYDPSWQHGRLSEER